MILDYDLRTVIVIDNGSKEIKAGLTTRQHPTCIPAVIGHPKATVRYAFTWQHRSSGQIFVGERAKDARGILNLKYPIVNGIVEDWDNMGKLWDHTFKELRVDPMEHPIVLTESALHSNENREKMTKMMFDTYDVPAFYLANQGVLCLHALGRSTGIVVRMEDGATSITPVYEGYVVKHAVKQFNDSDMALKVDLEGCTSYGEKMHRISLAISKGWLPGDNHKPIAECIQEAILKCDPMIRDLLWRNIVVTGETLQVTDLAEGLQRELTLLSPDAPDFTMTVDEENNHSAWRGGCLLGPTFEFVMQWQHEVFGPKCVHINCF